VWAGTKCWLGTSQRELVVGPCVGRDLVLARDEPTRTCCGPLPSWAPKIKTLEKIDFHFENQD
jgi:hypothetical protein